ncbi:hypothetical protein [Parachryseolinea silvisoli]|jgi:hypothetical protein|uniref:hypothetical protein n=1 Tax=Parachryseolinea silvisoli TaxID=2873601 RepID=UPI002265A3E8|nr:hypothetical protein [Parachryseolinea silvisoli]MCD9015540.1 hypothetical protein [Parachryseolinea silvisoli]
MKRFITNQGLRSIPSHVGAGMPAIAEAILTEHRNKLVLQVYAALENYVEWTFHRIPTTNQVFWIRETLEGIKDKKVNLEDLPAIYEEVQRSDYVVVRDEPFLSEINEKIAKVLVQN